MAINWGIAACLASLSLLHHSSPCPSSLPLVSGTAAILCVLPGTRAQPQSSEPFCQTLPQSGAGRAEGCSARAHRSLGGWSLPGFVLICDVWDETWKEILTEPGPHLLLWLGRV